MKLSQVLKRTLGRRRRRSVHSVLADFPGGDFSVLEASGGFPLLLCRFCRTVVDWTKRSRVQDHVRTRMHRERKDKAGRHIDGGDRASPAPAPVSDMLWIIPS